MNGLVSSVYELWGGGPQGGLLTVILFNINSNWLSDICQPGIPSSYRFSLAPVPVPVPRDAIQQTRDCPPAMLPPFEHLGNHTCPYNPKCKHAEWQLMVPLNPPAASKPSTSQNIPSESLPTGCLSAKTDAPCRVTANVGGSGVPCVETGPFCLPVLDLEGLCHCSRFEIAPHVPVLPQLPGSCFPLCREDSLRLLTLMMHHLPNALTSTQCWFLCYRLLVHMGAWQGVGWEFLANGSAFSTNCAMLLRTQKL